MTSNNDNLIQHTKEPLIGPIDSTQSKWNTLVEEAVRLKNLTGVTCCGYSINDQDNHAELKACPCGRLPRRHSFVAPPNTETSKAKPAACDLTVYGQLANKAKFIRCYQDKEKAIKALCQIIQKNVHEKPVLLISCFGGAEYFTMTDKLETEFMNGISQAALTKGVWLLTTGLNQGVSKLIGQSVRRYKLLKQKSSDPILIGMTAWGTVTDHTRESLKLRASMDKESFQPMSLLGKKALLTLNYDEKMTLEKNHSHFLLLDIGLIKNYLDDTPRSEFVNQVRTLFQCQAITIIVEGGFNTLEVIQNDLKAKRPVVIIHGSGRLASVLGTLLEITSKESIPKSDDVDKQLAYFFREKWSKEKQDRKENAHGIIRCILRLFERHNRDYLSVFDLERDSSLTDTIFKAVGSAHTILDNQQNAPTTNPGPAEPNKAQQQNFLELAISWNYSDRAEAMPKLLEDYSNLYPRFFEKALVQNRPAFVDYFLRRNHNPFHTTKFSENPEKLQATKSSNSKPDSSHRIDQPKRKSLKHEENLGKEDQINCAFKFIMEELYSSLPTQFNRYNIPKTLEELDINYAQLIGPHADSFYFERSRGKQLQFDLKSLIGYDRSQKTNRTTLNAIVLDFSKTICFCDKPFGSQEMLRELFLWSVYAGYADIAFVLLLQLESRMTAALIATEMAQNLSLSGRTLAIRHAYSDQAAKYEVYATDCINLCYEYNERRACQLLLRENPLFGNVTCMQVAVASRIMKFINTDCFNQVLDQQWYGQLFYTTIESATGTFKLLVSLFTFGLVKRAFKGYLTDGWDQTPHEIPSKLAEIENDPPDRWQGIEDSPMEDLNRIHLFSYFHSTPVVKMCYDFMIYIWFLLVFSYMMLFRMKADQNTVHWTRIYLIIAVSAMLIEEIRKLAAEYYTRMMERWHRSDIWMVPAYLTPYILFYIGIILYFESENRPALLSAARVILAVDLQIWYIFSLRFVTAIKLLGPKIFMIRNMLWYVIGFMYIIFVSVAAYGVASRALTMYDQIEPTFTSIFRNIIYQPYWFLYSIVEEELSMLNGIMSNATSMEIVVETAASQTMLVFHMLFINVLILNLLIAVFNFTINEVQEKNEYVWRYQRYELIREYFEKPLFALPPFSLLAYIGWFINAVILRGTTFRVFKHRCISPAMDAEWTEFENTATYAHARKYVENNYRLNTENKASISQTQIDTLQGQVNALHRTNEQNLAQTKQIMASIDSMMTAMSPVKMSSAPLPTLEQPTNSEV